MILARAEAVRNSKNVMEDREIIMFKVVLFAIILDDEKRVLLCHRRDYDLWNLPGGVLEQGEAPWDGVVRETKEETGLDVTVDRLAGLYSKPDQNEIVLSFLCKVVDGNITLTDEADQIVYFGIDNIPSNTSPKQVERIRDALKDDSCIMRVQRGPSSIELLKKGMLN